MHENGKRSRQRAHALHHAAARLRIANAQCNMDLAVARGEK